MGRLRAWVVWRIRRRCLPLHVCQTGHPYLFGLHGVFLRGGREVRSCFDRRSKTYFLLFRRTPPPNSISARVSSTSPDTNVSRVIGIFETAVCHCRSLFTRYHPHPPPPLLTWIHRGENPTMQACLYAPTMCLPLIFPSASIFFFPSSLRVLPFRPLINPLLTRERESEKICEIDWFWTDRSKRHCILPLANSVWIGQSRQSSQGRLLLCFPVISGEFDYQRRAEHERDRRGGEANDRSRTWEEGKGAEGKKR